MFHARFYYFFLSIFNLKEKPIIKKNLSYRMFAMFLFYFLKKEDFRIKKYRFVIKSGRNDS